MKTTLRAGLFCLCIAAVEWLVVASDYRDSVFLGTYSCKQGVSSSTLVVRSNQTFQQTVTSRGVTQSRTGTWRRVGEGVIAFSGDFLPLPGQELAADGTSYGRLSKSFSVLPTITLAQDHVLWYSRTTPAQSTSVAGTYVGDEEGTPATLVLRKDRTFEQAVTFAGQTSRSHGTWSVRKDGDILFSKDFLKTSGEPLTSNERASASPPKGSNLQIEVAVDPTLAPPVFRKKVLDH